MDCVVLAGGVPMPGDSLYPLTRGLPKAQVEVAGRTVGQRVIDALTDAETIDHIVIAGIEPGVFMSPKIVETVPNRGGLVDNFMAGVDVLLARDPDMSIAAGCTSDVPLLSGAMVDWFTSAAGAHDAVAGVIRREAVEAGYPDYPNEYWRLTDGEFTAADFIVFRPALAVDLKSRLEPFAGARKNALQTARLIGWGLLFRYLFRRLGLMQAERSISKTLGLGLRILDVPHPEMGLDLDLVEHVPVLERWVARR
ncbi:MAG: NTP transferase domain-containing protein [Gammaproteobacteria bacterium]|nr:NTP transferase domain-containing protein [Gammaproteobacteria bacterium]